MFGRIIQVREDPEDSFPVLVTICDMLKTQCIPDEHRRQKMLYLFFGDPLNQLPIDTVTINNGLSVAK